MKKVIFNLVFNRKKRLNSEGKALIQVEAYQNRQKMYFSTNVYVRPNQWDQKRTEESGHAAGSSDSECQNSIFCIELFWKREQENILPFSLSQLNVGTEKNLLFPFQIQPGRRSLASLNKKREEISFSRLKCHALTQTDSSAASG